MSEIIEGTITIRLEGQPTDDGRIYVTSPDLRGFHFVLDSDEEPMKAMEPTLRVFMAEYLKAEIRALQPAISPRDYRAMKYDVPRADHGLPHTLIAAVA